MLDISFLKALREKLKSGNFKSIHLNALPSNHATRLDVFELETVRKGLAGQFLELLFSKASFEFPVNFDHIDMNKASAPEKQALGVLAKKLNAIAIENEDNFKEHGLKTFSFGYPLLIKRSKSDPKKVMKAPMFIWNMDIIKSTNKINSWIIVRNKSVNDKSKLVDDDIHTVAVNEVLISYLLTDEKIAIGKMNDELLEDAILDKQECAGKSYEILTTVNGSGGDVSAEQLLRQMKEPVEGLPRKDFFEVSNERPWIHNGGVFGLFRTQKESIITDLDKLIENANAFSESHQTIEHFSGHPFSAVDTDPSQQQMLNTLTEHTQKIIQGPPGTGKSQSLTALITNALANGLKCLVVCEKKTALEVIKSNLEKQSRELSSLAVVIEDIVKGRETVVNQVRDKLLQGNVWRTFPKETYNSACNNLSNISSEINQYHRELHRHIFLENNWTNTVGLLLKNLGKADRDTIKNCLPSGLVDIKDGGKQMEAIADILKTAKPLFDNIQPLDHPLSVLHDTLLLEQNILQKEDRINTAITRFRDSVDTLRAHLAECAGLSRAFFPASYNGFDPLVRQKCESFARWMNDDTFEPLELMPAITPWEDALSKNQVALQELQQILSRVLSSYESDLRGHFTAYYGTVSKAGITFYDHARENARRFGQTFTSGSAWNRLKLQFLSPVSGKHKRARRERRQSLQLYVQVWEQYRVQSYLQHEFIVVEPHSDIDNHREDISVFLKKLDGWYASTGNETEVSKRNLSSTHIHSNLRKHRTEILSVEEKFSIAIGEYQKLIATQEPLTATSCSEMLKATVNAIQKIQLLLDQVKAVRQEFSKTVNVRKITHKLFTTTAEEFLKNDFFRKEYEMPERFLAAQQMVEEWDQKLSAIHANLRSLRDYCRWVKFYCAQPALNREVIDRLMKTNFADWHTPFRAWYLLWLIAGNENESLPVDDRHHKRWTESFHALKDVQIKYIIRQWETKQAEAVKQAADKHVNPVSLYNKRGRKGERRNSLRTIIRRDTNLFTSFFPVTLVSPTVCSSIIPLVDSLYDIVLFDEASQLRLEDTYAALLRGKIKIVSGDSQQMPPSSYFQGNATLLINDEPSDEEVDAVANKDHRQSTTLADSESLLEYAEQSGYEASYLQIHYRSQHPALIDFSNAAFYGSRLIPMPAQHQYLPIHYLQVDGVYEDHVNREEARKVIDILRYQIGPDFTGKYPSVGIGTFNMYQRNLIIEMIQEMRMLDAAFDQKMNALPDDFFVKNLENIQGDERDIIIISTTFGKKSDGAFSQHFGPVNQPNGYKLLNVLITRARQRIFVCTSVPDEKIDNALLALQQMKLTGRTVFYTYLAYAKSVSEGNEESRLQILDHLKRFSDIKQTQIHDPGFSESPFEEEVAAQLKSAIGAERVIQQHSVGGFRIDIVIKSKYKLSPYIAIECDGAKYHGSNEAYAWDMFRQKQLEQMGYVFHRIWSTNWWHHPEKELRKLVAVIEENDVAQGEIYGNMSNDTLVSVKTAS